MMPFLIYCYDLVKELFVCCLFVFLTTGVILVDPE